jgi:hypothetical protein
VDAVDRRIIPDERQPKVEPNALKLTGNALSFDMSARSWSTLKAQPNETGNSERVVGITGPIVMPARTEFESNLRFRGRVHRLDQ